MFPLSVIARAGIPNSPALLTIFTILEVDWRTENWELLCKWTYVESINSWGIFSLILFSSLFSLTKFFLIFSDSSLRLRCFKPNKLIGLFSSFPILSIKSGYPLKTDWSKTPFLTNSKNTLEVASTSADALWASLNFSLNKSEYISINVGNLYFPPRPPGNLQTLAVNSVQVSKTSFWKISIELPNLNSSAPIIFISNFTLCPTKKPDLL